MPQLFYKNAVTRQERFHNALVAGIPATFILSIAYGLIQSLLPIDFEIIYIAFGFAIGWVIRKVSHGVQIQFSVLAAVLCFFCFLIADCIVIVPLLISVGAPLPTILAAVFAPYLDFSVNGLLGILFRAAGIYTAFISARNF